VGLRCVLSDGRKNQSRQKQGDQCAVHKFQCIRMFGFFIVTVTALLAFMMPITLIKCIKLFFER
jgi:hypothetical protein